MFPCKIGEIFKNTFFHRTHPMAASGNISWNLSVLHLRTMNGVILRYVLALQRLLHFTAFVSFLSIYSFFFCGFYYFMVLTQVCQYWKQGSEVVPRVLSEVLRCVLLQPYLVINLPLRIIFCRVSSLTWYNIFDISLMVTCSLDALKMSTKKKKTRIKK